LADSNKEGAAGRRQPTVGSDPNRKMRERQLVLPSVRVDVDVAMEVLDMLLQHLIEEAGQGEQAYDLAAMREMLHGATQVPTDVPTQT